MGKEMIDDRTAVERKSERELVVTRSFNAPVRLVFDAWTKPELFKQWWAPKSSGVPLLACEMDIRTGGGYSVTFGQDADNSMTFFGKYLEVSPPSRLVWTNDESENGSVTTVTFEEKDGRTVWSCTKSILPRRHATNPAPAWKAMPEQFGQLEELLASLGANA